MSIVKTAFGTSSERVAHTVVLLESIRPTYQTTTLADTKKKESDINWERLRRAIFNATVTFVIYCSVLCLVFWLGLKALSNDLFIIPLVIICLIVITLAYYE